jgi:hypothetical protein
LTIIFSEEESVKMNVLGPFKPNSIAYYSMMVSGESNWLTREELMEEMNSYHSYDNVDVTPSLSQEKNGTLWYGFRLKAFKQGKPERTIILDGELETIKEREDLIVDTLYYFQDKITYYIVWKHWTKPMC